MYVFNVFKVLSIGKPWAVIPHNLKNHREFGKVRIKWASLCTVNHRYSSTDARCWFWPQTPGHSRWEEWYPRAWDNDEHYAGPPGTLDVT